MGIAESTREDIHALLEADLPVYTTDSAQGDYERAVPSRKRGSEEVEEMKGNARGESPIPL